MIKSFRHKGLGRLFTTGSKAGIQPKHASRLTEQLTLLYLVKRSDLMNVPGWDWHPLKGGMAGHWAISVNGNWRLVYSIEGEDALLVDFTDYH